MRNQKKKGKIVFYAAVTAVFLTILVLMRLSVIGFGKEELGGRSFFDATLTYYNGSYFYSTAAMMNASLIKKYFAFHLADYVFALCYYLLMALLLELVLDKKHKFLAYLLPALPALADACENLSIDVLLYLLPAEFGYAGFVGILSCIKWYSGGVWALITLGLGAYKLIPVVKKRVHAFRAKTPS